MILSINYNLLLTNLGYLYFDVQYIMKVFARIAIICKCDHRFPPWNTNSWGKGYNAYDTHHFIFVQRMIPCLVCVRCRVLLTTCITATTGTSTLLWYWTCAPAGRALTWTWHQTSVRWCSTTRLPSLLLSRLVWLPYLTFLTTEWVTLTLIKHHFKLLPGKEQFLSTERDGS